MFCMVLKSLSLSLVTKMSILTSELVIFTLNAVVMNGVKLYRVYQKEVNSLKNYSIFKSMKYLVKILSY